MMQIKIVKSTKSDYWYADRIGEVHDVLRETTINYYVPSPEVDGQTWLVLKEDAEIVNENNDREIPLQEVLKGTFPNGIDNLDHLQSLIASSHGDVFIYWNTQEDRIKYQLLLENEDQIETDDWKDVVDVLESMANIRAIAKKNKAVCF